jgi:hypothetical protein
LPTRQTHAIPILVGVLLTACSGDGPREIDIRSTQFEVPLYRLDKVLFHAHPDGMAQASLKAHAELGEFFTVYVEDILQGGEIGDPQLPYMLKAFVTDPDMRSVQDAVDHVLGDLEHERIQLQDAVRRLAVLFPDSTLPRLVAFNSGFNFGIFPTEDVLGIGLEWFIGKDHPVIGYLPPESFPQFVKDRMMPAMLVPSAVKGWLLVHYTRDIRGADVLTNLVEVGKIMALLDALLPDTEMHLKYAFSPDQLAWCEANEYMIWREIVAGEKLFSRKAADIGRLMNDGPFTSGLPRESPGHIGEWVGHRMVKAYLKANPKVTFAELFALEDPRQILKHYKPR